MTKLFLSGFLASLLLISIISYSFPVFAEGPSFQGKPEVIGISGILPGKDLIVHVLVVVNPDENKHQKAAAALSQQGARPFMPNEFTTLSLKWDQFSDGNPGNDYVDQFYNPSGDPTTSQKGQDSLMNSQNIWNSVASSNFEFNFAGTTDRCPSLVQECKGPQKFDGKNDVAWMRLSNPSTLGVTWTGTSTDEADMAMNTSFNWNTGYDAETVFIHENGHALGLGHSETIDSVMYPYYQGVDHTLHADDIAGIIDLYPSNSVISPPTLTGITISPSPASVSVGSFIQFSATADYSDGSHEVITNSVGWSSVNANIVAISPSGYAQGIDVGSTMVRADYGVLTDEAVITVNPSSVTPDSVLANVNYSTDGGKNGDRHLNIGINLDPTLADATVTISLYHDGNLLTESSGITNSNGNVGWTLKNASSGHYSTQIDSVVSNGSYLTVTTVDGTDNSGFEK